jgi:lambda family phage portal protein
MADADGRRDLTGLLWDAVVAMVIDGEAFLVEVIDGDNHLRWRLVPAEQLDSGRTEQLANGHRVIGGIELDANGVRLAYHFFTSRPGDPLGVSLDTLRMPAESVLHLYRPLEPGQLRGVSWLAPVLSMLTSIDRYHDARLMQANVAALVGGFIRDPSGEFTRALAGGEAGPVANVSLEPGMFPVLPGDGSVDVVTPPSFTDNGDFVKSHLRAIARAVGLTYEQLSGDLTGVNYSSIRAGQIDARRLWESWQYNLVIPQLLRPLWRRWIDIAVLRGDIDQGEFDAAPDDFYSVEFIPPAFDWVDPEKDLRAEILAMGAGVKSRREVVARRGYDIDEVDAEIAADQERAKKLGLTFGLPEAEEENAPAA